MLKSKESHKLRVKEHGNKKHYNPKYSVNVEEKYDCIEKEISKDKEVPNQEIKEG